MVAILYKKGVNWMLKQSFSRIKKVLTILLAVLFTVSLAAAAASNANYYTNISTSNGWHITIVSFPDGPANIFETYTGDYDKNYTQYIEDLNETMYDRNLNRTVKVDLVEDINVVNEVSNETLKVNGEQVSPDSPLRDIMEITYNTIIKYKFHADEQVAQQIHHLDKDIVSLPSEAASNANYYKNITMSNGWHNIIVSFSEFGGAHFFGNYTSDSDRNYTQHVEALKELVYDPIQDKSVRVDFVEDINVKNGVMNAIIEIDGKLVDLNNPLAEQAANAAHGTIGNFQMHADEAAREAQQPPHLDSNILQ